MKNTRINFYLPILLVIILCTVHFSIDNPYLFIEEWGLDKKRWVTIFTGPFIHINIEHLSSNIKGLLLTMPMILYFYKKDFWAITILGIVAPFLYSYFFIERDGFVGISGLAFTYIWFIIFTGFGSKNVFRLCISLFLLNAYGRTLKDLIQLLEFKILGLEHVIVNAYEVHAAGIAVGLLYAIYRYNRNSVKFFMKDLRQLSKGIRFLLTKQPKNY